MTDRDKMYLAWCRDAEQRIAEKHIDYWDFSWAKFLDEYGPLYEPEVGDSVFNLVYGSPMFKQEGVIIDIVKRITHSNLFVIPIFVVKFTDGPTYNHATDQIKLKKLTDDTEG